MRTQQINTWFSNHWLILTLKLYWGELMRHIRFWLVLLSVVLLTACERKIENPTGHYLDAKAAYDAGSFFEAERLLKPIAIDGHVDAQYLLADIYITGKLGDADATSGLNFLDKAAEAGHVRARSMMGVQYINGTIVDKDLDKGVEYISSAARSGNPPALKLMGFLYYHGEGVEKDLSKAASFYHAAAIAGESSATKRLRDLAETGQPMAMTLFGLLLKDGSGGVPTNAEGAAKMVKAGADGNVALAQYEISQAFGVGQGFEQDYLLAHMYANLAAAQGYEGAEKRRDTWAQLMTPEQIAEAQKMARDWTSNFETSR